MKLIDANVFIYAAGREHPFRSPCRGVLRSIASGDIDANTDVEVFQELLNYYQRGRALTYGRKVFEEALDAFPEPLLVTIATLRVAEGILLRHLELQARDAVHAAVVLEHGLEGIVSADRGFDGIPGVTRFDPLEL